MSARAPDRDVASARAEEEHALLDRLYEVAPVGLAFLDRELRYVRANAAIAAMKGASVEAHIGRTVRDMVGDDLADKIEPLMRRVLETGEDVVGVPITHELAGKVRHCLVSYHAVRAGGEAIGVQAAVVDVTPQKEAEEARRALEHERGSRRLLASSPAAVFRLRPHDHVPTFVTENVSELLGYDARQLSDPAFWSEHVHPEDRSRVAGARAALFGARRIGHDFRCRHRDGGWRWLHEELRATAGPPGEPPEMIGCWVEVTDRKEVEARLMFADRMASVGNLVAGLAHEINNPLSCVLTSVELLDERVAELASVAPLAGIERMWALLAEARQGAERVRAIVQGLKSFCGGTRRPGRAVDLARVAELSAAMAGNEIKYRARLVTRYDVAPPVEADETQLGQVIVNLLVNAAEAVPEGRADRNEIHLAIGTDATGRAVIEVRDSGVGIAPHLLGRIFEPFFTTKPMGEGTGLGLAVCHGIVSALGGEIRVESTVGKGTTFRVLLPAAAGKVSAPPPEEPTSSSRPTLRGSVLVVDDDRLVGVGLKRVLEDHDVTVVESAGAALELFAEGRSYDVVLCDLMMPGMTGMELYDVVCARWPALAERFAIITGGAFTPAARRFLERWHGGLLEKPVDVLEVRLLVQDLVARARAA
jgi:PAS domain S-box-containing protein